ncbi:MAG: twin-arginine translocase subunit TatB [Mesorhizobium sp.]|nr:Sec-independent protein translocase protein TatB [Mesorhizobium sp.]MBL8576974.1 twin-arginine translocase subunit TatB [Mesorhizobium sp.]
MFEIGWTEMLVIAVVMIVVVGPKDLPKMLRTFGRTTAKLRSMAGDFQRQFNDALKEAELDDVKKSVDSLKSLNPANEIKKQLNPFEKAAADVRSGLDTLKPKPPEPASPVTHAAEPLKAGPTTEGSSSAIPAASASVAAAVGVPDPSAPAPATAPQEAVAKPAPRKARPKSEAKPKADKPAVTPDEETKPKAAPRKKKTESSAP